MALEVFDDLRQFIEGAKKITEHREIKGASWDLEISTLIEATAELIPQPPMLLFDEITGYPPGFRVLGLPYAAYRRVALAFGLPHEKSKLELVRLASRKVRSAQPIPPREISRPPVMAVCTCMSQNPGTRNFPRASTTRAPAGMRAARSASTLTIRLPRTTTVRSGRGSESVPSMTETCVNATVGCAWAWLSTATSVATSAGMK